MNVHNPTDYGVTAFFLFDIPVARFYWRIVQALDLQRHPCLFVIQDELVRRYVETHFSGIETLWVPMFRHPQLMDNIKSKPALHASIMADIHRSMEYVFHHVDEDECPARFLSTFFILKTLFDRIPVRRMFVGSGTAIVTKACAFTCKMHNVERCFIEQSNLPDTVFLDPIGVNADSSLARDPVKLDALPDVSDKLHQQWMLRYEKFKQRIPPQARDNPQAHLIEQVSSDRILEIGQPFIFAPLQVSHDAQLALYTDKINEDLIRHAAAEAQRTQRRLVVKIHPAEVNVAEIQKVVALKAQLGFALSAENTTRLLQQAAKVITINSTVGLEAQLYGKDLEILGDCFYRHFDRSRLKKYIHHYLFGPVKFFSEEPIPASVARRFIRG